MGQIIRFLYRYLQFILQQMFLYMGGSRGVQGVRTPSRPKVPFSGRKRRVQCSMLVSLLLETPKKALGHCTKPKFSPEKELVHCTKPKFSPEKALVHYTKPQIFS
jgi:hypothetical protein